MKLTNKEQMKINLIKHLFDSSCRTDINTINFSGVDRKHSERVSEICHALYYDIKTPFYTEAKFKTGWRPDILCPLYLGGVVIEVRNSETQKESDEKIVRIPKELEGITIIYSDCHKPFKLRDIQ